MAKVSFDKRLGIDQADKKIIEMLQEDPEITHSEIAEEVGKSQPAIGARILKLERKNLLAKQVGADLSKIELHVAIVQISTRNVEEVIDKIKGCPFINYIFKTSGEFNLTVFLVAPDLEVLENVVDAWFRDDENVLNVKTSIIIAVEKKFVIPLNFHMELFDRHACGPIDKLISLET